MGLRQPGNWNVPLRLPMRAQRTSMSLECLAVTNISAMFKNAGEFSATDPDANTTLSYFRSMGNGSAENAIFRPTPTEHSVTNMHNFRLRIQLIKTYGIRVQAKDGWHISTPRWKVKVS